MRHWLEEQILYEVVKNPLEVVILVVWLGRTMLHLLEKAREDVAFVGGDFVTDSGISNSITWRWRIKVLTSHHHQS